jgi:hypothetical protein
MNKKLTTCFDIKSIVHFEFILQGQRVNRAYYVEVLKRIYEAVHRKRPEILPNVCILHHENAPAHKVLSVKQFLAQANHSLIWLRITCGCF